MENKWTEICGAICLLAVASCTAIVNKDDNLTKCEIAKTEKEIAKNYIEQGYVQRKWNGQWMKYEDFKEKYLIEKWEDR